jgi:hypothetical protein
LDASARVVDYEQERFPPLHAAAPEFAVPKRLHFLVHSIVNEHPTASWVFQQTNLRRLSGRRTHYVQQPIFIVGKSRKILVRAQLPQRAALNAAARSTQV